ncbi:MBL fold metallo-hydrolase [Brevibacterium ravenspurgense]|uniref:MBL fold metallo-hydrolase n=1 Tax=Brevibacterium ravenspurgense TaxID=479117 RepID=UPI0002DDBD56|nr:MBL fold metallo-hydrolase [Brevibacterium ravenspurgense]
MTENTINTSALEIRWIAVSDMENNVYLVTHRDSGTRLLVDAADDWSAIKQFIGDAPVERVLTTHRHWDHVRALADALADTGAVSAAGEYDADAIEEESGAVITERLKHGEIITVGDIAIKIVHLRGHTPGSIALIIRDGDDTVLISGDSLFPGGPGKTWSPEDFTSLMADLRTRIFDVLPDSTVVLPGHGAHTTIGTERPHLDEWQERGW